MMKKLRLLALLFIALLLFAGCRSASEEPVLDVVPEDVIAADVDWGFYNTQAEVFVLAMVEGDFDAATGMFGQAMADALDAAGLRGIWDGIVAQAGDFVDFYDAENLAFEEFFISFLTARHEESGVVLRIVFSEEGLIMGFFTDGFPQLEERTISQRDGFTEYPVVLGEGTAFPLDATLAMPDDASSPVPAVVIVAGSGAHNMDGAIFGNTPYRDIAHFLAANGIAVIRHDRRLYVHPAEAMETFGASLTVREEIIEDSLLAVEVLRADPRIDSDRIYIIGHSLGGMLAPRIHVEGGDFAGLILMAGSPRDLLGVAIEQMRASISTAIDAGLATEADLAEMIAEVDLLAELMDSIADMSAEEARETILPLMGVPAYYFQDLTAEAFAHYAAEVDVPILVMQPARDFQVLADVDFVLLQEIFAGRSDVTFLLYADLNHLFVPTTATNFTEHGMGIMESPGRMYAPVLQDIVDWILGR